MWSHNILLVYIYNILLGVPHNHKLIGLAISIHLEGTVYDHMSPKDYFQKCDQGIL